MNFYDSSIYRSLQLQALKKVDELQVIVQSCYELTRDEYQVDWLDEIQNHVDKIKFWLKA